MKVAASLLALAVVLAPPAGGQASPSPAPTPRPAASPSPAPAPTPRPRNCPPVNVRLDVSLAVRAGEQELLRRSQTLLLACGERGSVRSQALGPPDKEGRAISSFNLDARVRSIQDRRIQIGLTLNFGYALGGDAQRTDNSQVADVLLEDGRSVVLGDSQDSNSGRRVLVEAKATLEP